MYTASKPWVVRLLEAYIGERDKGRCEFRRQMHSVIDVLVEQFDEIVGAPKACDEVLHTLCAALAARPSHYDFFTYRKTEPHFWDPDPTALAVALWAKWDAVIASLLEFHPFVSHDLVTRRECRLAAAKSHDFGRPLDMVIGLGRVEQVEMLLEHGARAEIDSRGGTCAALQLAAKRGYSDVLELVLPPMLTSKRMYQDSMNTVGKVLVHAARHREWHIAGSMVQHFGAVMMQRGVREDLENTLWLASTHARNDIICNLLQVGLLNDKDSWMVSSHALRNAVASGHLSTCQLLLPQVPELDSRDLNARSEDIAQCVARGGSVEICRLLKKRDLWKPHHEIHFLPIAAERGHLEFAKYAVENGCDRTPNIRHRSTTIPDLDERPKYPDDIRYFALLRAVISGHQDMVRWLVDEVGVDLGTNGGGLRHPGLCPVDLAKHANDLGMEQLLLEYHPDFGCSEPSINDPNVAFYTLARYRDALHLRQEDYDCKWKLVKPSRAKTRPCCL
jgi:hypothetical protein